jgi:hypothetical protein
MAANLKLALIVRAVDQLTKPVRGMAAAVSGMGVKAEAALDATAAKASKVSTGIGETLAPARKLGQTLSQLGKSAGLDKLGKSLGNVANGLNQAKQAAGQFLLGAGGIGYLFKTQFLDSTSEFEGFFAVLKQLEGGADKANKSMKWIEDFAASTPYELAQVTEAFVKLRSYGLDPTNGLLRTLGDTSAAMNKDVMDAVEAIADAVNGENERLKEFGVKASVVKNKIVYEYTQDGKQKKVAVNKSDRAAIEKTLSGIFNEKFGGSMGELSKTWKGVISNLMDWWSKFSRMVMGSGAFDFLKEKAKGVLAYVEELNRTGQLKELAEAWGTKLVGALQALWSWGSRVWNILGMEGVLTAVALVIAGPLLAAIASLTAAFVTLGVAIGLTPLGWVMAAIAALVAGAYLLIKYWDDVAAYFTGMWAGIKAAFKEGIFNGILHLLQLFDPIPLLVNTVNRIIYLLTGIDFGTIGSDWMISLWDGLRAVWDDVTAWFASAVDALINFMPDWVKERIGLGSSGSAAGAKAAFGGSALPETGRTQVGGSIRVSFDNAPTGMRVGSVSAGNSGVGLDVDAGYNMLMP